MALTSKQKQHLRGLGHHLNAVVLVGNAGVTDAVIAKIVVELDNHELIKVKVHDGAEDVRAVAPILAEKTKSEVVQIIGKIAVLYKRRKEKPEIVLPRE